jgi:hypothetical protein
MTSESFKKYIPVIIVVGLLVLLNLFAVVWYVVPAGPDRFNEETVSGKVVSVTETSLTTRDPRGNTKTFIITSETQILAGKKIADETLLQPGTMVLVELDLGTSTGLVAQEIRVLTDKRKEKERQ